VTRAARTPVLAACLAIAACGSDPSGPGEPIDRLPRSLTAAEAQVISAGNVFGIGLFREVFAAEAGPNVFLSPLSAHMALGMALNGASGGTLDAMRATLGFADLSEDDINRSYRDLIRLLLELDPRVEMAIGNSVWIRQGFPVLPTFLATLQQYFDAEARQLDFDAPTAPATINAWVRRATRNRIDGIVERIDAETVMYLINAVYFKAKWTQRFDPAQTRPGPFRARDGSEVRVPFMNRRMTIGMFADELVQVGDLPYGGGAYRMTLVLPQPGVTLDRVVAALSPGQWNAWVGGLRDRDTFVSLPRWRLEYDTSLNDALKALGMEVAFMPRVASFRRIADEDLYISNVRQKTFIRVDEDGTEAAAATSVEIGIVSAPPPFTVDRPFLVAIRERLSGTIVFLGAIGRPEE
jgi:serine protease inhibitor